MGAVDLLDHAHEAIKADRFMTLFERPIAPETYALVRFGMGFPALGSPPDGRGILTRLAGPDRIGALLPVISFDAVVNAGRSLRAAQRDQRKGVEGSEAALKEWRVWMRTSFVQNFTTDLARIAETDDPFRERLHRFWANHFTARSRRVHLFAAGAGYAEQAIRPHLNRRFAEMLKAAVTHPFMMVYLDQVGSVGPNSPYGKRRGRGLNENLAREVLELHTLGVGAAYTQADVTQFAELLTGLNFSLKSGARFQNNRAEPGAETVLGKVYGGGRPALADIHAVLEDLARHPATASHICRKLAAHFVADQPDAGLVAAMTGAYRDTDGELGAVYAAMLDHPAAWRGFGAKVKQPLEFMATSLRALGVRSADLQGIRPNRVRKIMMGTLRRMGQQYQAPPGPDGWPDTQAAWVQPHGMAARIAWAMDAAARAPGTMPDPREFVVDALGDAAGSRLVWAAGAAQNRIEGVGLVLASAEFNRR